MPPPPPLFFGFAKNGVLKKEQEEEKRGEGFIAYGFLCRHKEKWLCSNGRGERRGGRDKMRQRLMEGGDKKENISIGEYLFNQNKGKTAC